MVRKSHSFKGFTLIELVVVIAIIGILATIMSFVMNNFARDNRLETNNAKAKVVYDAFQDILIDCEVKQDESMFEVFPSHGGNLRGVVLFFRISDKDVNGQAYANGSTGLGDEIHIMNSYDVQESVDTVYNDSGHNIHICSRSVVKDGSMVTINNALGYEPGATADELERSHKMWSRLDAAVAGRIDPSMQGTYCVMIDYENYEVKSVICRELVGGKDPKTGLYDPAEMKDGNVALQSHVTTADKAKTIGSTSEVNLPCRMYFINNLNMQQDIYADTGVITGCYPFADDVYDSIDTY